MTAHSAAPLPAGIHTPYARPLDMRRVVLPLAIMAAYALAIGLLLDVALRVW